MVVETPVIVFMAVEKLEVRDKKHLVVEGMAEFADGKKERVRVFSTVESIVPLSR